MSVPISPVSVGFDPSTVSRVPTKSLESQDGVHLRVLQEALPGIELKGFQPLSPAEMSLITCNLAERLSKASSKHARKLSGMLSQQKPSISVKSVQTFVSTVKKAAPDLSASDVHDIQTVLHANINAAVKMPEALLEAIVSGDSETALKELTSYKQQLSKALSKGLNLKTRKILQRGFAELEYGLKTDQVSLALNKFIGLISSYTGEKADFYQALKQQLTGLRAQVKTVASRPKPAPISSEVPQPVIRPRDIVTIKPAVARPEIISSPAESPDLAVLPKARPVIEAADLHMVSSAINELLSGLGGSRETHLMSVTQATHDQESGVVSFRFQSVDGRREKVVDLPPRSTFKSLDQARAIIANGQSDTASEPPELRGSGRLFSRLMSLTEAEMKPYAKGLSALPKERQASIKLTTFKKVYDRFLASLVKAIDENAVPEVIVSKSEFTLSGDRTFRYEVTSASVKDLEKYRPESSARFTPKVVDGRYQFSSEKGKLYIIGETDGKKGLRFWRRKKSIPPKTVRLEIGSISDRAGNTQMKNDFVLRDVQTLLRALPEDVFNGLLADNGTSVGSRFFKFCARNAGKGFGGHLAAATKQALFTTDGPTGVVGTVARWLALPVTLVGCAVFAGVSRATNASKATGVRLKSSQVISHFEELRNKLGAGVRAQTPKTVVEAVTHQAEESKSTLRTAVFEMRRFEGLATKMRRAQAKFDQHVQAAADELGQPLGEVEDDIARLRELTQKHRSSAVDMYMSVSDALSVRRGLQDKALGRAIVQAKETLIPLAKSLSTAKYREALQTSRSKINALTQLYVENQDAAFDIRSEFMLDMLSMVSSDPEYQRLDEDNIRDVFIRFDINAVFEDIRNLENNRPTLSAEERVQLITKINTRITSMLEKIAELDNPPEGESSLYKGHESLAAKLKVVLGDYKACLQSEKEVLAKKQARFSGMTQNIEFQEGLISRYESVEALLLDLPRLRIEGFDGDAINRDVSFIVKDMFQLANSMDGNGMGLFDETAWLSVMPRLRDSKRAIFSQIMQLHALPTPKGVDEAAFIEAKKQGIALLKLADTALSSVYLHFLSLPKSFGREDIDMSETVINLRAALQETIETPELTIDSQDLGVVSSAAVEDPVSRPQTFKIAAPTRPVEDLLFTEDDFQIAYRAVDESLTQGIEVSGSHQRRDGLIEFQNNLRDSVATGDTSALRSMRRAVDNIFREGAEHSLFKADPEFHDKLNKLLDICSDRFEATEVGVPAAAPQEIAEVIRSDVTLFQVAQRLDSAITADIKTSSSKTRKAILTKAHNLLRATILSERVDVLEELELLINKEWGKSNHGAFKRVLGIRDDFQIIKSLFIGRKSSKAAQLERLDQEVSEVGLTDLKILDWSFNQAIGAFRLTTIIDGDVVVMRMPYPESLRVKVSPAIVKTMDPKYYAEHSAEFEAGERCFIRGSDGEEAKKLDTLDFAEHSLAPDQRAMVARFLAKRGLSDPTSYVNAYEALLKTVPSLKKGESPVLRPEGVLSPGVEDSDGFSVMSLDDFLCANTGFPFVDSDNCDSLFAYAERLPEHIFLTDKTLADFDMSELPKTVSKDGVTYEITVATDQEGGMQSIVITKSSGSSQTKIQLTFIPETLAAEDLPEAFFEFADKMVAVEDEGSTQLFKAIGLDIPSFLGMRTILDNAVNNRAELSEIETALAARFSNRTEILTLRSRAVLEGFVARSKSYVSIPESRVSVDPDISFADQFERYAAHVDSRLSDLELGVKFGSVLDFHLNSEQLASLESHFSGLSDVRVERGDDEAGSAVISISGNTATLRELQTLIEAEGATANLYEDENTTAYYQNPAVLEEVLQSAIGQLKEAVINELATNFIRSISTSPTPKIPDIDFATLEPAERDAVFTEFHQEILVLQTNLMALEQRAKALSLPDDLFTGISTLHVGTAIQKSGIDSKCFMAQTVTVRQKAADGHFYPAPLTIEGLSVAHKCLLFGLEEAGLSSSIIVTQTPSGPEISCNMDLMLTFQEAHFMDLSKYHRGVKQLLSSSRLVTGTDFEVVSVNNDTEGQIDTVDIKRSDGSYESISLSANPAVLRRVVELEGEEYPKAWNPEIKAIFDKYLGSEASVYSLMMDRYGDKVIGINFSGERPGTEQEAAMLKELNSLWQNRVIELERSFMQSSIDEAMSNLGAVPESLKEIYGRLFKLDASRGVVVFMANVADNFKRELGTTITESEKAIATRTEIQELRTYTDPARIKEQATARLAVLTDDLEEETEILEASLKKSSIELYSEPRLKRMVFMLLKEVNDQLPEDKRIKESDIERLEVDRSVEPPQIIDFFIISARKGHSKSFRNNDRIASVLKMAASYKGNKAERQQQLLFNINLKIQERNRQVMRGRRRGVDISLEGLRGRVSLVEQFSQLDTAALASGDSAVLDPILVSLKAHEDYFPAEFLDSLIAAISAKDLSAALKAVRQLSFRDRLLLKTVFGFIAHCQSIPTLELDMGIIERSMLQRPGMSEGDVAKKRAAFAFLQANYEKVFSFEG
jgi:hypothetical protein